MAAVTGRAAGGIAALCLVLTVMACRVEDEPGEAELGGADAPGFELQDLHGSTVTLEELRGKAVVLDFWATWCTPCVFQIPVLNAFHEQHGDRIEVIGIAVDAGGREVVAPFAAEHGIDYRVLLGDEGLAQRYGAPGFPALYVITPDGQIDSAHVGLVQEGALEASVRAALARTPPL